MWYTYWFWINDIIYLLSTLASPAKSMPPPLASRITVATTIFGATTFLLLPPPSSPPSLTASPSSPSQAPAPQWSLSPYSLHLVHFSHYPQLKQFCIKNCENIFYTLNTFKVIIYQIRICFTLQLIFLNAQQKKK